MIKPLPLPKAVQVSETLIREIASGRIPTGARLPTEREMATEFGVAVGTLRKALDILQTKGILNRVQGSGNYVIHNPDAQSIYSFFRLELPEGGGLPTSDVLRVDRLDKPDFMPNIGESAQAHRIRRLRYLDDISVALEEIWLDTRFVETITSQALNDSLYYYYKEELGLVISAIKDTVGVATIPSWSPPALGMMDGDIAGFVERTGYDPNGIAAEYSRTWFNADRCTYTNRLGGGKT